MDLATVILLTTEEIAIAIVTRVRHNRPILSTIRRRTLAGGPSAPNRNLQWT